jgi:hypothetical protein
MHANVSTCLGQAWREAAKSTKVNSTQGILAACHTRMLRKRRGRADLSGGSRSTRAPLPPGSRSVPGHAASAVWPVVVAKSHSFQPHARSTCSALFVHMLRSTPGPGVIYRALHWLSCPIRVCSVLQHHTPVVFRHVRLVHRVTFDLLQPVRHNPGQVSTSMQTWAQSAPDVLQTSLVGFNARSCLFRSTMLGAAFVSRCRALFASALAVAVSALAECVISGMFVSCSDMLLHL